MDDFKIGDEVMLRIDLLFMSVKKFKKGTKFTISSVRKSNFLFSYILEKDGKLFSARACDVKKYVEVKQTMPEMK